MSLNWAGQPMFWGLVAISALSCAPAMAQDSGEGGPISQPTVPEKVDQAVGTYKFWPEITIVDDAKTLFTIGTSEGRIEKRSKNFEALYLDLQQQQADAQPIVRTQDAPNPFSTSLQEILK
jgi:hypothetical protein